MRVELVTTWSEDFKHLESRGVTDWAAADASVSKQNASDKVPVTATL